MPASGPQPDRFVPGAEAADQGHAGDGGWLASTRNNWARLIAVCQFSSGSRPLIVVTMRPSMAQVADNRDECERSLGERQSQCMAYRQPEAGQVKLAVLRIPEMRRAVQHIRGKHTNPLDHLLGVAEPSHVRVAGSKKTVCRHVRR